MARQLRTHGLARPAESELRGEFKEWARLADEEASAEQKARKGGESDGRVFLGKKIARKVNWGPWYIARIVSRKKGNKLVGYGATCGCHQNVQEVGVSTLQCKKHVVIGGKQHNYTEEQARMLCKYWLLWGVHMAPSSTERSDHVRFTPHEMLDDDTTEADLDALAEEGAGWVPCRCVVPAPPL